MKNISVKLTVLLVLILFVSLKASAAYMSFAFTNSLGAPITNDFRLVKVGDTLSDGSVIPQGLPIRVTPSSDGRATNRLQTGNWYATNSYLSQAIRFRVPQDDGPTVYFFTDPGIWVSGGSYFVTQVIGGSNAAPTYNQVTNALGYLPLTQSKLDDTNSALIARIIATNSLNMAATVTNIGGAATNLTVKASGGAGSKAISAKDVIGAEQMFVDDEGLWLPQMISSSGLQLVGINDSGLLSKFTGTLTNNTSGNSSLATNSINATNIYGSGLVAMTNAATQVSAGATNGLNSALVTRITLATNALAAVVTFNLNSASNVLRQATINATNDLNTTLATRIQNSTNDLNTALIAADTVVSNGLSARIVATNAALATRMDDATNSLNTTLSTKITNATNSLNSALVTRIQNATNDLNTALVAANTVVSNGLSARLIATNAALISADTVVSNGLSARLIATNNSLQTQILNATNGLNSALVTRITDATNSLNSALVTAGTAISNGLSSRLIATNVALLANDTTVSNGLSARIIATNSLLTTRITDATNSLNTVLMSQISATTNDYKVRVIAAGTNITVLTNATAGIYTVSSSFDSNSVYAIGLQAAYTVGGATGGVTVATANTLAQTNIAWRVPNMLLSGTNLFPGAAVTGTLTNNTTGNAAGASNIIAGTILNPGNGYNLTNLNLTYNRSTNGGWVSVLTNLYNSTTGIAYHHFPSTAGTLPGHGVRWSIGSDANQPNLLDIWYNTIHDTGNPSSLGSELQMTTMGSYARAVGYGAGIIKHEQKGIGPVNPRVSGAATMNPWSYAQRIAPYEYEPGYTWADTYRIDLLSGAQKFPGFVARHWTNDAGFGERWELSILKDLNVTFVSGGGGTYVQDVWSISNVVDGAGYYVYTSGAMEGFYNRGARIQAQVSTTTTGSTNIALDFGKSSAASITAATGAWKFYTTNNLNYSTNYQRMVFLMKATGAGITNIAYPNWQVPTNVTLLTSVPGDYYYRLELESFGPGDTNKSVVSAMAGVDRTYYFDSDAQSYFDRAGGLSSMVYSNAVNQLVLNLKATNLWTLMDAIYPYAGTTDRINTNNLKSSSFGGVFTGSPAFTAGFVADGSNDYMATGFIPSSAGGNYTQDSAHIAVYTQSTTMDDNDRLLGVYDTAGGTKGVMIRRNATTMQVYGPNSATYTTGDAHGGDYSGFMCGSRTNSANTQIQVRASYVTFATASTALPTKQIYVGALNNDGTAGSFTAGNFRCVTIGGGLTAAQMNALKWCMEQYVNQMP